MHEDELLRRAPELYHVTSADSWDGLLRRGLMSVEQLVALHGLDETDAKSLLSERRSVDRRLEHPEYGIAWIRDQQPLNIAVLEQMLDDMTPAQYLRRLNGLVFLWADPERLERLWRAPRYAGTTQVVLTLDTASVLEAHRPEVVLTRINSGAARGPSGRRGTHTFRSIADFPSRDRVVEFAVADGLPDVRRHLVRAWSRRPQL